MTEPKQKKQNKNVSFGPESSQEGHKTAPDHTGSQHTSKTGADMAEKPHSQKTASGAETQKSASNFAKINAQPLGGPASIESWMFYRKVVRVPVLVSDEKDPSESTQFTTRMSKVYNDMTEFRWPKKWKTKDDLPKAAPPYDAIRDQLWADYEAIKDEKWVQEAEPLDDESTTIIEQNFQAMLHEVASASGKALPVDYEQNEAEARHSWDRLFYLFYTGKNEMSSPYVLPERDVLLAGNTFLREIHSAANDVEARKVCNDMEELYSDHFEQCHKFFKAASTRFHDLKHQATAASAIAAEQLVHCQKLCTLAKTELLNWVMPHSREEPERSRCDAVLCAPTRTPVPRTGRNIMRGSLMIVCPPSTRKTAPDVEPSKKLSQAAQTKTRPQKQPKAAKTEPQPQNQPNTSISEAGIEADLRNDEIANPLKASSCHSDRDIGTSTIAKWLANQVLVSANRLNLVVLIAEYKKISHTSELLALNQTRMGCVTSVIFHGSAIGLYEEPVFGLSTAGSDGVIIMASMPKPSSLDLRGSAPVYLFERNVRKFDLAKALNVFQFATFLTRLKARAMKVVDKYLNQLEPQLLENLETRDERITGWVMPPKERQTKTGTSSLRSETTEERETGDDDLEAKFTHMEIVDPESDSE